MTDGQTGKQAQPQASFESAALEDAHRQSTILLLQNILESTTEFAIEATDLDLRLLQSNPTARQIFGYDIEAHGSSIFEAHNAGEETVSSLNSAVDAVRAKGKSEWCYDIRPGEQHEPTSVHSVMMPMRDEAGVWTGYVIISRDVTCERQRQEELRKAKVEAERANRMKSQFLANVSHEIRTPLNGVIGLCESILHTDSFQNAKEQAETILMESEHLMSLINTLLDHAKIEAGKLELECLPFALDNLLETVISGTYTSAKQKNIELRTELDRAVPLHILADPLRLRQILLNLVNNAIKFTDSGAVVVRVESINVQEDWATIRFSVKDTGIGIPKDKQKLIFESFSQADGSTTRKYGGTGLGTAICKEIVQIMGGEMGLESEPGRGSTFWFSVDVGLCKDLDEIERVQETRCKAQRPTFIRKARILVAEDYPTNQEVVRIHLNSAGHAVHVVENGLDAVQACRDQKWDMIFMDVQMPEMDGLEATRRIRHELDGFEDIPIIALTANGEIDTRLMCLECGMNDVVTKPVRAETLLSSVAAWLPEYVAPQSEDSAGEASSSASKPLPKHSEDDPMNFEQAVNEFAGNADLVRSVLESFLRQVDSQIEMLQKAAADQDADTLRSEAHKIKGGAANLTARNLANAAAELESLAKAEQWDGVPAAMDDLRENLEELQSFVLQTVEA